MNIFYLHKDPITCAKYHCDKHVVKMILEYAQLLSTAHHVLDGEEAPKDIYKKCFVNHPCAIWVRQSAKNYLYVAKLFFYLLNEYRSRYYKKHKTSSIGHNLIFTPKNIPEAEFTEPPKCMPDEVKLDDTVESYRNYYIQKKSGFARWARNRQEPDWYTKGLILKEAEEAQKEEEWQIVAQ